MVVSRTSAFRCDGDGAPYHGHATLARLVFQLISTDISHFYSALAETILILLTFRDHDNVMTSRLKTFDRPHAENLTLQQAEADRQRRAGRHADNCILLAVVTSQGVAAELIDHAIEYRRQV